MLDSETRRPDPDELLRAIRREEEGRNAGKLRVFFGMCAGVGKTYEMLRTAREERRKGVDLVVGYVETHGRLETESLLQGLEIIPRRMLDYRGTTLEEMDLDVILERKPALVLVDELAHTNAPGSRHPKRYQDVIELLENGISVYTTLNVQHLESRAETVAQITGAIVRETVPDSVFSVAHEVELIDVTPDELLERLAQGKVYLPESSQRAREHFFRKGNLTALREMALRLTAERVDHQLREYMRGEQIVGPWKSGQRLVVALSPSPHSKSVIRWARRTAYTLNATWIAVYVELPRPLTPETRKQLEENIRLARELGAEVVTTADVRVDCGLLRVARQEHATHILVGKSAERAPFWRKSLFDHLLEESSNLDIYVVSGESEQPPASVWKLPRRTSSWAQYAAGAGLVSLVASACFPLREFLGYQTVSLVLLLTVTLLALRLGPGPILLAATLSALIWNYFFIPPLFTWRVHLPEDMLMLGAYFIIALVTGVLSARTRINDLALRQREERASALFAITRDLSRADTVDGVVAAAVANVRRFFGADVAVILSATDGDLTNTAHHASTYPVDEKEFSVASWAYWNERKAGRFTDTLPGAQGLYFPLSGPRYSLGVVGVKLADRSQLSLEQETLLQNFMDQIASALERESLSDLSARAMVVAESERLYKTLFDSVSHEIRTPLAAIAGSAEELMNESAPEFPGVRRQLIADIQTATERLNRLVENLLDMTRLESGLIKPRLDWCDIRDVLNAVVMKAAGGSPHRQVSVTVDADVPLMKLDYGLIEQAVANIVHNALVYSPPATPVTIHAVVEGSDCSVTIADRGPGIPPGKEEEIFGKFYRVPGTRAGGMGLGLSIVRGFLAAHRGTVTARNRAEGGAEFVLRIPILSTTTED
jgi:two-component system sensor histidine kinase KdpD